MGKPPAVLVVDHDSDMRSMLVGLLSDRGLQVQSAASVDDSLDALRAAEFDAVALGNSGCRTIEVQGAIGEMSLDFSGERWAGERRLIVKVGLGDVRTIPKGKVDSAIEGSPRS